MDGDPIIVIPGKKGAKDRLLDRASTIRLSREYSEKTGKFESLYSIKNNDFAEVILDDLQSAGYIAEQAEDGTYIGTELKGHIYQKYLPGQFFTMGGKYYEMVSVTKDNRILVRRASEHINGRLFYRQNRHYTIERIVNSNAMGDLKTVNDIDIYYQFADFSVETFGFWKMTARNDFDQADLVQVNAIPERRYYNKQILKLDFTKLGDAVTPEIRRSLTNLMNEVFVTLFAENHPFILALTPGEVREPITYSLGFDENCESSENAIYIIEDSQLDIGLLVAVARNLNRILQIISDYLSWNEEMIAKSTAPKVEVQKGNELKIGENLWERDDVPKTGWTCEYVRDLGEANGNCEMCGEPRVRYMHHMVHPVYHPLDVGVICAGKLEGDPEAAERRNRLMMRRAARYKYFLTKKWKENSDGSKEVKFKGHTVVLKRGKTDPETNETEWMYIIDSTPSTNVYKSEEEARREAFAALDELRGHHIVEPKGTVHKKGAFRKLRDWFAGLFKKKPKKGEEKPAEPEEKPEKQGPEDETEQVGMIPEENEADSTSEIVDTEEPVDEDVSEDETAEEETPEEDVSDEGFSGDDVDVVGSENEEDTESVESEPVEPEPVDETSEESTDPVDETTVSGAGESVISEEPVISEETPPQEEQSTGSETETETDKKQKKPGFFARLFGRGKDKSEKKEVEVKAEPKTTPVVTVEPEPVEPEQDSSASEDAIATDSENTDSTEIGSEEDSGNMDTLEDAPETDSKTKENEDD